ncbi:Na+/H+ antiporter [Dermacoccaceae bacterium W4C1]
MHVALPILALVATVVAVSGLCRRLGLSAPLVLTAAGAVVSFLPGMPVVEVDSEVILLGFLPPLLFAAASQTSLIDLRRDRRQILGLSVGLVLFTSFGVALVAWWLMPIDFAAAVALGAVVAPPDAVAATAVARRIGLPRRVVSILEGESLFNDATALVTLRTALAATAGTFTVWRAGLDFLVAALGGAAVGVLAFFVISFFHRRINDTTAGVVLSFMSPWLAYLPAEEINASGVIAAVVCGVLLAHRAPYTETAQTRVAERMNWASITFVLENLVFLLIGLQASAIVDHVVQGPLGVWRITGSALLILLTVIVLRMLWLLSWAKLGMLRSGEVSLSPRESLVAGWAGMRGVVTLAAAFTITTDAVPLRDALIFVALVVTVGTLVIQGFTLGWVARRVGLHAPDPREDALQQAQLLQAAAKAGRHRLAEELQNSPERVPEQIIRSLRSTSERRANLAWERLGRNTSDSGESPTAAYRRLRMAMIEAERDKVLKFRRKGTMDHAVVAQALVAIDIEESMIAGIETRDAAARERMLLTPEHRQGGCAELQEAPTAVDPKTHDETCAECVRDGTNPVALRLCLTCGNVGCCDSSVGRHATHHYEQTGHPVMRSFEPGEAWRWCYRHQLLG